MIYLGFMTDYWKPFMLWSCDYISNIILIKVMMLWQHVNLQFEKSSCIMRLCWNFSWLKRVCLVLLPSAIFPSFSLSLKTVNNSNSLLPQIFWRSQWLITETQWTGMNPFVNPLNESGRSEGCLSVLRSLPCLSSNPVRWVLHCWLLMSFFHPIFHLIGSHCCSGWLKYEWRERS